MPHKPRLDTKPLIPDVMEPLAKERRHPADYRDELEHAEVAAILAELAADHPACVAYYSGSVEGSSSTQLTHLVPADRPDLVERLKAAYLAHSARIWDRSTSTGAFLNRR